MTDTRTKIKTEQIEDLTTVLSDYVQDAPSDNEQYVRQNEDWVVLSGTSSGGLEDAPVTSGIYARQNEEWIQIGNPLPLDNFIINGDFNIWQRGLLNSNTFTSMASNTYTADRFKYIKSGEMVHDATYSSSVPTVAQSGHKSDGSLKITCTTADTDITTTQTAYIRYIIEGYDYKFLYGNNVTLSFWVRAYKTGTYCIWLYNNSTTALSYVHEYTIDSSDTWEKKVITINMSEALTLFNSTYYVSVAWVLACGPTRQTATVDTWQAGVYYATSNQVNACDSTDNTFYLSQVKLELGTTATTIRTLRYADELQLCKRYCQTYSTRTTSGMIGQGVAASTTLAKIVIPNQVSFRSPPTTIVIPSTITYLKLTNLLSNFSLSDVTLDTTFSTNEVTALICTASGLTAGAVVFLSTNNASGFLIVSGDY